MERSRGLGTVAVVCTMAGVASGLALATTLMAMQVADSMATRACPYQSSMEIRSVDARSQHGFLGIGFSDGSNRIDRVLPGTPAEAVALQPGDFIVSINGEEVDTYREVHERIYNARPGSRPLIVVERDGQPRTIRPTLISWQYTYEPAPY